MSFWRHFVEKLPGVLALKDGHALALGHTASLPTCEARRRGEKRMVRGGAGVADREVVCRKDAADAYAWWDAPLTETVLTGTTTVDLASVANGASTGADVTVTGAAAGDPCQCGLSSLDEANWLVGCQVYQANTAHFHVMNRSGGAIDPPSGTLRCDVTRH